MTIANPTQQIKNTKGLSRISVIVPTFNRAHTLARCLKSIQNQTFREWECWIVDDGSTDATQDAVKGFLSDSRFQYLRTTNQGVSAARNHGIQKASGDWMALLDSDDEWLPHKLETQLELAKSSGCLVVHGEERWIRNGVRVNAMKKHKKPEGRVFLDCLPLCCMSPSTILIHKSVLSDVGYFREDFIVCEDYELWLRIAAKYEVAKTKEEVTVKYGGHEDQLSRQYKAMDEYRVKALLNQINNPNLKDQELAELKNEILKKSNILIKGYKKYGHESKHKELLKLLSDHHLTG